ncbi:mogroside I-E synthase-like [Cicer arietinum]|uniref:UDP-glycosyltransferase 74E1-like n=1 Tax=Cicer arietinum TaxID=3827 RepID=A0A1S2XI78_CICAR|nr:UDP-glycosyltransferase 74E1-like [Cicer arietinum]
MELILATLIFFESLSENGLIVTWCLQLQVLEHESVVCFVTHCGWSSTLEALSLGVAVIAMPIWTDQITNAKFIVDVWKIGVKAIGDDEKGIVRRETIVDFIRKVMESEKGNELEKNCIKWKNLANNSVDEGGSSDGNIVNL